MDQADIKKAAKLIAAECVQPASNGNGYRLHACENFPAYTGLGFACAGASAKDLTIEEARAQIADLLAMAMAKGAEMERARVAALLSERETEALGKARQLDEGAALHRKEATRLAEEAAALVARANDLATLRALATTQDT